MAIEKGAFVMRYIAPDYEIFVLSATVIRRLIVKSFFFFRDEIFPK